MTKLRKLFSKKIVNKYKACGGLERRGPAAKNSAKSLRNACKRRGKVVR